MIRRSILAAALLALAATPALGQQQRIAGDIVTATATNVTVRTTTGTSTAKLPPEVRITARLPAEWSAITQGSYVGTTAVPQADGTLLAKEVHIFTEAQRGTGEGHYPMPTPGDTMTNATVSKLSSAPARRDTMTNATVAAAGQSGDAHHLTLTYKGGEQTVVVPNGVPVIRSEPGDRSLLVPGAHVVVYAKPDTDGALLVERISVGKNGFSPPI